MTWHSSDYQPDILLKISPGLVLCALRDKEQKRIDQSGSISIIEKINGLRLFVSLSGSTRVWPNQQLCVNYGQSML